MSPRENERPKVFAGNEDGHAEVFYCGETAGRVTVRSGKKRRPLDPRFDLRKHSLAGFAWGNADAGPAQLSLALLADTLHNDARALKLHHHFSRRVVTIFPERWTITRSRILAHVELIDQQAGPNPEADE
jgi:Family of unknown function (DUF6166)